MNISNATPFPALAFDQVDSLARLRTVVVANACYDIADTGHCVPSAQQAHAQLTDLYYGDPKNSSLRFASEICFTKVGTDIYFLDPLAVAPKSKALPLWPVSIQIGSLQTNLIVTGPRCWRRRALGGWTLESPEPCLSVPIRYEHAFGGQGPSGGMPFATNPVGVGLVDNQTYSKAERILAPRIYHPEDPPTSPNVPCRVVGLTPISPAWEPRLSRAGTYDDQWLTHRWPNWPTDFDSGFFSCGPGALRQTGFLQGSELVMISGMSQQEIVTFQLPQLNRLFLAVYCASGEKLISHLQPGTVVIDLGKMQLVVCFRTDLYLTAPPFYSLLSDRSDLYNAAIATVADH